MARKSRRRKVGNTRRNESGEGVSVAAHSERNDHRNAKSNTAPHRGSQSFVAQLDAINSSASFIISKLVNSPSVISARLVLSSLTAGIDTAGTKGRRCRRGRRCGGSGVVKQGQRRQPGDPRGGGSGGRHRGRLRPERVHVRNGVRRPEVHLNRVPHLSRAAGSPTSTIAQSVRASTLHRHDPHCTH